MRYLVIILCSMFIATTAGAWGEIFPIKVKGVEYCDSEQPFKLTTKTAIPQWIKLTSGDMWELSFDPSIPADPLLTAPLFIDELNPGLKKGTVAVLGSVAFDNGAYLTFTGTLKADKEGGWKGVKGFFMQTGSYDLACWSSGKIKTSKRIN